ncbi:hypothetical protein DB88DRAFT_480500 [Papiliotrema laurentii]|uniref:Glutamate--tRNA ligase, mitochondrial n=1 Tax=Papiliotrema laurentii TaxID=5418 RepID=A0AAD9L7A6_PAPLA|nr:hypothetical protein DB88DRAFT_480500 [Papiliotrema laurentii]
MRPPSARIGIHTLSRACVRCHSTTSSEKPIPPRVRFAPSPTGYLHLGGLRTALVNYLVARKGQGKLILRVEDTDQARLVPGAVDALRRDLEWAGLQYDEGVGAGGPHGPYVQSERRGLYHQHVKTLLENDKAYECFCSPADLEAIRKSQLKQGNRVSYDGRCRHLTDEDRVRRKKAGQPYIVRFKDPGGIPTMPTDLVFGEVNAHTDAGHEHHDDYVLMKTDGYPTYHLANVVDDHEMQITHVLRGEEWLPSLPKHVSLYSAFGWSAPAFGHLPLLVNETGAKLSKRKDDVGIESFRERGYEPEALLNFLGLLGWDYQNALKSVLGGELPLHERRDNHSLYEFFTLPQLVQAFDISQLSRRRSMVNLDKLDFLNKMTLRAKAGRLGADDFVMTIGKTASRGTWKERGTGSQNELWSLLRRYRADLLAIPEVRGSPFLEDEQYMENVFHAELPRITRLNQLAQASKYFYIAPEYDSPESQAWLASVAQRSYVRNLEFVCGLVKEFAQKDAPFDKDAGWSIIHIAAKELDLKIQREVVKQMRHALMGRKEGPSVPEIMAILGPKRTLQRLREGIEWTKGKLHGKTEVDGVVE